MKRSKGIIRGIMICALVVLPFFSAYAAEKQVPAGTPSKIITKPLPIKLLPDLIVERVWLDDQSFINFQLKNAGQGEIPDGEHRQGMVRVTYGNKYEDLSFTRSVKMRPAVDPTGLLKKPNGVVQYNTGILVKEKLTIKVVVDSLAKIAEVNDQNNQGTLLPSAPGTLKGKVVQPVSPEMGREIAQKEEAKTREGEGPGRGADGKPDLSIAYSIGILEGPGEGTRQYRDRATYTYNGGGEHEDIEFVVEAVNYGDVDFYGSVAVTVYPITSPGPGPLSIISSPVTISVNRVHDFKVFLHQSEWIAQGKLSPGKYKFMAKIKYFDGADWKSANSHSHVTLKLTRPHPVVEAIPKATITLTSEPNLTGTVPYSGPAVDTTDIQVGGGSNKRHGFISFDLSPLREKIRQWRGEGWLGYEVKSATLTLDEYYWYVAGSMYSGSILFDWVEYGESLDLNEYWCPMYGNLCTFTSAQGIHTIEHLEPNIQVQLEGNRGKIQFRLRLLNEDQNAAAHFRKPCQLMVVIRATRSRLQPTPRYNH